METSQERRRRMERLSESERGPGDPRATTPTQARAGFAIMVLVLIVAIGLIAAMFVNNPRYDGNSSVPVSEQRR
jgi:ABC-type Fe3+ transport system permease subunit